MKIFGMLGLAGAFIVGVSGVSSRAHAETLADVIAYAYQTSPALQAQRAAQRALDESYVQARAGYGLSANVSVSETSYNDHRGGTPGLFGTPKGDYNTATGTQSLTITQPLYTGGRVHSRVSQAEARILAGRQNLRQAELEFIQKIVTAYSDVLRDQELLKIGQDTVTVLEKEASNADARFAVREVTMTDVAQTKARLAQAQTQLSAARAALNVSRAEFVGVVGQSPGTLAPLPALTNLPVTIDQAFDAGENDNPQLLSVKYVEQESRARIAEAKASALPTVSAQLSLSHAPYLPYSSTPYDYVRSGSIVVQQPIFTGGQISSAIRQATQENNRDRLIIDDVHQQLIQAIATGWERLVSERSQLSTLEAEVKADDFAFYGVGQEQKLALRQTIDVLNAQLELTNAQKNLVTARAAEYVSRVQLLALTGLLTPQTLSPNIESYDPTKNFRNVENRGGTPLDFPVRVLDGIAAPPIGSPRPASVSEAVPKDAPALPPTPPTPGPLTSILTTLDQAPPKP